MRIFYPDNVSYVDAGGMAPYQDLSAVDLSHIVCWEKNPTGSYQGDSGRIFYHLDIKVIIYVFKI